MTYEEAIEYIETKTWSTTRLGLERTTELLERLENPHKKLRFIHVAGSNGKGSTCSMLESALRQAGYRTGLYTSPHLMSFCERFQVNGEWIRPDALASITEQVREQAEQMADHPSQFEISTAIAMLYFLSEQCEIVILEVGMGGELDSTNVIPAPEVAVITNIGLEHTEYLGDSLEKIAATKGGIIKTGSDVVLYPNETEVEDTIAAICRERKTPLHHADPSLLTKRSADVHGQSFVYENKEYRIPLTGEYQLFNASVALKSLEVLRSRGWKIPEESVVEGFAVLHWPARMEMLWDAPMFFLDGGHNPQCIEALAGNLKELFPKEKITFLLGFLGDKDYRRMLELLKDTAESVVCVTPNSSRALPSAELLKQVREIMGRPAESAETIEEGIRKVLETEKPPFVAVGSLYMAGELREVFPKVLKQYLRRKAIRGREQLDPEKRKEYSDRITDLILQTEEYAKAKTILSYHAVRAEVSLERFHRIAESEGKTLAYPVCMDSETMEAMHPNHTDACRRGAFGIREPDPNRSAIVPPEDIDLILCPCAGFDPQGGRIGMGAGYYDRYLQKCGKSSVFAVAFEAQKLKRAPMEDTDIPMDAVITEKNIYKAKGEL